jgi:hypothetical protein
MLLKQGAYQRDRVAVKKLNKEGENCICGQRRRASTSLLNDR